MNEYNRREIEIEITSFSEYVETISIMRSLMIIEFVSRLKKYKDLLSISKLNILIKKLVELIELLSNYLNYIKNDSKEILNLKTKIICLCDDLIILVKEEINDCIEFCELLINIYFDLYKVVGCIKKYSIYFRGEQDDYTNKLTPKVFREKHYLLNEKNFVITALTNYPDQFTNMKNLEILSKMQHYGFPTRLLDLTSNPFVALYFACSDVIEDIHSTNNGYVYIFYPEETLPFDSDRSTMLSSLSRLSTRQYDEVNNYVKNEISSGHYFDPITDAVTSRNELLMSYFYEISKERTAFLHSHRMIPLDLYSSFYVIPKLTNDRIKAQHGLFLICGLEENFIRNNKIFARIKVDISNKNLILNTLNSLNIHKQTLFPELYEGSKYFINKFI